MTAPSTAPSDAPKPTMGNSRSPSSLRVEVVGERPELRDDHQVEHADPEEVRDADRHPDAPEHVERDEARDEEVRHDVQQRAAIEPRGKPAVVRYGDGQQRDLAD